MRKFKIFITRCLLIKIEEEDIVYAIRNYGLKYDVGSSYPGAEAGSKGPAVRRLKWHASWVQNVVRQFGLYPLWTQGNLRGFNSSKKLLLGTVMCHDNVANNGETFIC